MLHPAWSAALRDLLVEEIYVLLARERGDAQASIFHERECLQRRDIMKRLEYLEPVGWQKSWR